MDQDKLIMTRGRDQRAVQGPLNSLREFLFRPISPMPRTFGRSKNLWNDPNHFFPPIVTSSASFGLMHSQEKCAKPNLAARFGSCSVNWQK